MPNTHPLKVHPDERWEIVEELERQWQSIKRTEQRARNYRHKSRAQRDEFYAFVTEVYPKIGIPLIRETTGVSRQRIHQWMEFHEEKQEAGEDA